jgi:undecaprenyl-phosphate 4-deoxy-4-formamido-L-arabinose transferase
MSETLCKSPSVSPSVSIVIPVFNEQENLPELLRRTLAMCRAMQRAFEVILIDDGSRDDSPESLTRAAHENPGEIICVLLNRNYGQHNAIMAGFAQARGDIIITLDADLQNPPEEIPRLVAEAANGFDVVGTIRRDRQDSGFRKIASATVNKITAKTTGVEMHDYGCMLRAYRRPIVDAMLQCGERSTFIPVLANSFARRTTEIVVGHAAREFGESKYSVWQLINLQFDLLTATTTFPLRVLSLVGTAISFLGIGFGILLLILRLAFGTAWAAEGVFTLFAILFIFVGAQFVGLGLLGEYIGRIYTDVRARPRYFVQEVVGESSLKK